MFDFRSAITIKILGYYFINPQKKHYINELARILTADPGNLYRKLKELEQEGILVSEQTGNQKYYYLNNKYPLLKEVKRTYEAKYGLVNLLKEKLAKLADLKEAYIFGSYADNSLQQESDIDILLVGNHSALEAKRLILPMQSVFKRELNIIDLTPVEFKARQKRGDEFIKNVFSKNLIKIL